MERRIRLRKNYEFSRLYRRGETAYNRDFKLIVLRNGTKRNRYGFSISKKLGKAHIRNRLKRRLREIVRCHQDCFPSGYDYVFIPREIAVSHRYQTLERSVLHCLKCWNPQKMKRDRR